MKNGNGFCWFASRTQNTDPHFVNMFNKKTHFGSTESRRIRSNEN